MFYIQLNESKAPSRIGDRPSSDVVVRIRTQDGRDHRVYCHSHILVQQSKYFADRLSDTWPTCQILDSRNCVEVHCEESDLDYYVNVLRLFYVISDCSVTDICQGVRSALGILRAAFKLGCPQIITACAEYLEAVPWEETEEEDILKTIPGMGSQVAPVIARLQPVLPSAVVKIFLSAMQFATSLPPESLNDLKTTAQEQLEYMVVEDDDAPLLTADNGIKLEVVQCIKRLHDRFSQLVESLLCDVQESISEDGKLQLFKSCLSDLSWACQILTKLEIMRDFVHRWTEISVKIIKVVQQLSPEAETIGTKLKVLEVAAKVLEAIGYGTVVLPATKRLHMAKVWLPFVRAMKPLIDSVIVDSEDDLIPKIDGDLWQSLEASFVSMILTLPSADQAEILTEWWTNQHVQYPDLTEAFEAWCYRSKAAKRRLAMLEGDHSTANPIFLMDLRQSR
nr:BTB/POZ domain-containing protein At3g05675 [Ipomoea batatas]GMD61719.1 BTB/POZ domain-containing protein At3g05675 [Ipomoea batatas]GME10150.1 BTB/POZ domain-containing protein At3g05675 [Ipomoea batatas]